jgi:hypothetical protein
VLMLAGALPLIGATALILHGNDAPGSGFYWFFFALLLGALVCAGILIVSWILPLGSSRKPLSHDATKAMTAPAGKTFPGP